MPDPYRATFQVKEAGADYFDIGKVAIGCEIDFDMERKCWRAYDEHGNEACAEWMPLAAARLFVARMERDMEADVPAAVPVDPADARAQAGDDDDRDGMICT